MKEINLKNKSLRDVMNNVASILGVPEALATDDRTGFIIERINPDSSLYHVLIIKKIFDPQTKEATYSIETDEGTLSPRKSANIIKYINLKEMVITLPNVLFGEDKKIFIEMSDNQGIKKLFEIKRETYSTHLPDPFKESIQKTVLNFKKGDVIFEEGTEGDEMYIIQKGLVGLFKESSVYDIELAELKENNFFGEMALMGNPKRSASARALQDTELLIITKELLELQLNNVPSWFIAMFKALIDQLRTANEMIKTLQKQIIDETSQSNRYINMDMSGNVRMRLKEKLAEQTPRFIIHH